MKMIGHKAVSIEPYVFFFKFLSYTLLLLFDNGTTQNPIEIKFFFIITGIFGGYGFWHGLKK
jgi:hypothetical protein